MLAISAWSFIHKSPGQFVPPCLYSAAFEEEKDGGLAQLGERRVRNAEVEGSNPLPSTRAIRRLTFRLPPSMSRA